MAISNIDNRDSWYDTYDERGKKAKTLSGQIKWVHCVADGTNSMEAEIDGRCLLIFKEDIVD